MNTKLIEDAKRLEPIMRIGKSGITDHIIEDLKIHLKKRKLIKVKFLKSGIEGKDRKKLAEELASKTDSTVIQQVGFVVVLHK